MKYVLEIKSIPNPKLSTFAQSYADYVTKYYEEPEEVLMAPDMFVSYMNLTNYQNITRTPEMFGVPIKIKTVDVPKEDKFKNNI